MKYVIDRFEGSFAVVENTETLENSDIKRELLPNDAKEGDVLSYEDGRWRREPEETESRAKSINELFNKLKNRN